MKRLAVIGAGVSGLTCARCLKDTYDVTVFEREAVPGGLIRCKRVNGSLFHLCGGHVFNTKNERVRKWFWDLMDQDRSFVKADRNSAVYLPDGRFVPYPIENHVYLLEESVQHKCILDFLEISTGRIPHSSDFDGFLRGRFGATLYELYFGPYNKKVWRRDLSRIPLSWLDGKLPMPTIEEILFANMNHVEEKQFVHSVFWYERSGGSQYLADVLASGIPIRYGTAVDRITLQSHGGVIIAGEPFDKVIFCGNLKDAPKIFDGIDLSGYDKDIHALEWHGTTAAFCELAPNPYSWIYQPDSRHESHRIICTGNFSPTNNAEGKMTGTVEFTDERTEEEIVEGLKHMPFHPRYVTKHFSKYSYPIQHADTRAMIMSLKEKLSVNGVYLVGRFAEWEYFNMDAAMASAMRTCDMLVRQP